MSEGTRRLAADRAGCRQGFATRQQQVFYMLRACTARVSPALLPPYPQPLRTEREPVCLAGGEQDGGSAWREPSAVAILLYTRPRSPTPAAAATAAILRKRLRSARLMRSAGQARMRKVSRMPRHSQSGQRTMTSLECSYTAFCATITHHRPAQGAARPSRRRTIVGVLLIAFGSTGWTAACGSLRCVAQRSAETRLHTTHLVIFTCM